MDARIPPVRAGPHEEHRRDAVSRAADDHDAEPAAPREGPARDPAVSGPHAGHDRYGRFDYRYWRCEACGLETTQDISDGCPRCARLARRTAEGDEEPDDA
ncbi:hypothetical protein [Haloglomus litoreum]|uniref:hypothetical protein n=1 Tax=Haloglomus litoreum TaxID=3034026 RepID=UPI0023E8370F|nr:hypothetical protein [Haloglomus sp. DT116]